MKCSARGIPVTEWDSDPLRVFVNFKDTGSTDFTLPLRSVAVTVHVKGKSGLIAVNVITTSPRFPGMNAGTTPPVAFVDMTVIDPNPQPLSQMVNLIPSARYSSWILGFEVSA